jgi:hypothetical protein
MDISLINPKCFSGSKLFGSREKLLEECVSILNIENAIIAEVGVFQGVFSEKLLKAFNPKMLHLIDIYNSDDTWNYLFKKDQHLSYIKNKFKNSLNVNIIHSLSWDGLESLENNTVDFIYIDAGHAYEHVKLDIEKSLKKIKKRAVIQFNDYTNYSVVEGFKYGVFDAVNEFLVNHSPKIIGLSLANKGYHDLAVLIER